MSARILESNKKIEPLGDHPRDCLIGNQRLGDIQKEVVLDHSLHSPRLKEAMPQRKPEAFLAVLAPCQRLCYTKNTPYLRR